MAYSPAGNLTSSAGLAHQANLIFHKKKALSRLQKVFVFRDACMKDMIARQQGRMIQWHRWNNPAAVTAPSTEGAIGTSITFSNRVLSATLSQYTSFGTVSDFLVDTAPDPLVQSLSELLGYQGGLSVDTITRGVIDAESASTNLALLATYLRLADLRNANHQLKANDVEEFDDGWFFSVAHPYVLYDVLNDPAASGFVDINKYVPHDNTPLVKYETRGSTAYLRSAGVRVVSSTNVKTLTAPNRYRVYVFGKEAVGSADLEGRGPSNVRDPMKQRFAINIIAGPPDKADPEGNIGAAVSYNFSYVTVVLDGPSGIGGSYRYKTLDAESTIG